jgi:tungstate transport system substrate-binding protein
MRHNVRPRFVALASVAAMVALVATVIAPAAAFASVHKPTIALSTTYQTTATRLTVSGYMGTKYKGRAITIQVKKPGRPYWDTVTANDVKVGSNGSYHAYYRPMLAGSFYVRSRYVSSKGTAYSRTVSFRVKRGPGVKYDLVMQSTTSTRDSGLIEALLPAFLHDCPEYNFKGVFVGSGAAITNSRTGNGDVLLAHSPADELKFMDPSTATAAQPYTGKTRYKVMYNDFVLVGPTANAAQITTDEPAVDAFGKIAATTSTFFSRNDNSGTNAKEKEIWSLCTPANPQIDTTSPVTYKPWYMASGTMGMAQALSAANQGNGYTLADRATWLNAKGLGMVAGLKIVNQGDSRYFNQYSVIEINGARNWQGGQDFSRWIRSAAAQEIIRTYGISTYGQALFVPNEGSW